MSDWSGFARLCAELAAGRGRLEKRSRMAAYLRSLSEGDAGLAALYLAGRPFAEADGRSLNVGASALSRALLELTGAGQAELSHAYRRHGDLGDAAAELLAGRQAGEPSRLTLAGVAEAFAALALPGDSRSRMAVLGRLLAGAGAEGARYLVKLMLGDMRTGVGMGLVEEALAEADGNPLAEVRRAGMLTGDLGAVAGLSRRHALGSARMRLFHPLGFMLASPVASTAEAIERFAEELEQESADPATAEAGTEKILREAELEDKYDGVRCQLHCGDPARPGRVALFSRSRDDITMGFPELAAAFSNFPVPVILDGEILAWSFEEDRALPFACLQQRLGRRHIPEALRQRVPVAFMAFDLLYEGGQREAGGLLLDLPLKARRARLEALLGRYASATVSDPAEAQPGLFDGAGGLPGRPRLLLAPARRLHSEGQLEDAYREARARGNEGVMLKALPSRYQPGRRGLAWLKLKRRLGTLDVVVTAAELGHGKRAGILSDYTFAVRDGERLVNVGKAYSGLTDAEIARLSRWFEEHTLEDRGHLRTVEPGVVLEVAFNNVMRSGRHGSGFALRFPRIVRIREDKPVEEIDTLARVEQIYAGQPDRPAEGTRP